MTNDVMALEAQLTASLMSQTVETLSQYRLARYPYVNGMKIERGKLQISFAHQINESRHKKMTLWFVCKGTTVRLYPNGDREGFDISGNADPLKWACREVDRRILDAQKSIDANDYGQPGFNEEREFEIVVVKTYRFRKKAGGTAKRLLWQVEAGVIPSENEMRIVGANLCISQLQSQYDSRYDSVATEMRAVEVPPGVASSHQNPSL